MDELEQYLNAETAAENVEAIPWGPELPILEDDFRNRYLIDDYIFRSTNDFDEGGTLEKAAIDIVFCALPPTFSPCDDAATYPDTTGSYLGNSPLEEEYQELVLSALRNSLSGQSGNWRLMGFTSDAVDSRVARFPLAAYYWWWRTGSMRKALSQLKRNVWWCPVVFQESHLAFEHIAQEVRAKEKSDAELLASHEYELTQEVIDALRAPAASTDKPMAPTPTAEQTGDLLGAMREALLTVTDNATAERILARLPHWLSKNDASYRSRLLASILAIEALEAEGIDYFPIDGNTKGRGEHERASLENIASLITQKVESAITKAGGNTRISWGGGRESKANEARTKDAIKRIATAAILSGRERKEEIRERVERYNKQQEQKR